MNKNLKIFAACGLGVVGFAGYKAYTIFSEMKDAYDEVSKNNEKLSDENKKLKKAIIKMKKDVNPDITELEEDNKKLREFIINVCGNEPDEDGNIPLSYPQGRGPIDFNNLDLDDEEDDASTASFLIPDDEEDYTPHTLLEYIESLDSNIQEVVAEEVDLTLKHTLDLADKYVILLMYAYFMKADDIIYENVKNLNKIFDEISNYSEFKPSNWNEIVDIVNKYLQSKSHVRFTYHDFKEVFSRKRKYLDENGSPEEKEEVSKEETPKRKKQSEVVVDSTATEETVAVMEKKPRRGRRSKKKSTEE